MPETRRFLLPLLYTAYALVSGASLLQYTAQQIPWDFTINWTAAQGMRQGISLYAHDELRNLGLSLVGPHTTTLFRDTFTSYIGLPSTALLILPFTLLQFTDAVTAYQVALLVAFGASVYITGLVLPRESRAVGWLVGAVALRLFHPALLSVGLGQVDALVMLSLAIGLWAASKQRWWLAGAGIGVAALLKISPALLILYLLLKGKHKAVAGALVAALLLLGLSAIAGRADDLLVFARDVAPSLSAGSAHVQNQSLPGWLARLLFPETDLLDFSHGLGPLTLLGLPAAIAVTVAFYLKTRKREPSSLDYGFLILLALLAGPITWDHYTSWAILPLMLLCDARLWEHLRGPARIRALGLIAIGAVLLMAPTRYFPSEAVEANWWLRLLSGTKTAALLLWSGITLYMIFLSDKHKLLGITASQVVHEEKYSDGRATLDRHQVRVQLPR